MTTEVMTDAEKRASEHYIGGCPECGNTDGYLNIHKLHWFRCDAHKVKWCTGRNVFSSWRYEDEKTWKRNRDILSEYREVPPRHKCSHLCAAVVESGMNDEDLEAALREWQA